MKRKCTEEERKYYEEVYKKEKEKYERDLKCGGVDPYGNYTRLHDRAWEGGR